MSFDLLIAGTSVKTSASVETWDGVWQGPVFRENHVVVPSRRGQVYSPQEYDANTFSVPLILLGTSQGDFQDRLDTLRALCGSSAAAVTVARTKPSASLGTDLTTSCTATARIQDVGANRGLLNGRVILEVVNLDGCWYGASVSPAVPATLTVAGTGRTNRISLTLPGAGTLANTTLGVSLVNTTGAHTIDVRGKTTTGALSALTATGDPFENWFTLAPGSNVITWSGSGTPTLTYYPAYL